MKDYRIMLLGIALILFGIACNVMLIGFIAKGFLFFLGRVIPFVGIIVATVGLFSTSTP